MCINVDWWSKICLFIKVNNVIQPDKTLRHYDSFYNVVPDSCLIAVMYDKFSRRTVTVADPMVKNHVLKIHNSCDNIRQDPIR